jgi:hypothetical protein
MQCDKVFSTVVADASIAALVAAKQIDIQCNKESQQIIVNVLGICQYSLVFSIPQAFENIPYDNKNNLFYLIITVDNQVIGKPKKIIGIEKLKEQIKCLNNPFGSGLIKLAGCLFMLF